jgi:hypothetical protein
MYQASNTGGNPQASWAFLAGSGSTEEGFLNFAVSGTTLNNGWIDPGNMPVSWDFSISAPNVSWNLFFGLSIALGNDSTIYPSFSTSGTSTENGNPITGSGVIVIPTGGNVLGYSISLNTAGDVPYEVQIPAYLSLDLNPQGVSQVPEPATLLLIPGGAALLFLRRRKRV